MSEDKPTPTGNPARFKVDFQTLLERAAIGKEILIAQSGKSIAKFEPGAKAPRTFFDTNILVYADDASDAVKQQTAVELIKEHRRQSTGVVSLQVLQEYFVTVTRKFKLDPPVAREQVVFYSGFSVAEPTVADILAAIDMHRLHGFSYWDALVVRMAKQSGCRVILSEDMQCGRRIDGMEIVNPFL